jgi:hypothetical protein
MSEAGKNTDPEAVPAAIDEWRVDVTGPAESARAAPPSPEDWSESEAGERRARVRRDLEDWRSELDERVRRLEKRLGGSRV